LNGKLDLTEAEGLADLIEASTEAQRDQALALAGGALRAQAEAWRHMILGLQAQVEADIDFSDEGDVPDTVANDLFLRMRPLQDAMVTALGDCRRGEILRRGFTVVLAGAPNAGKSSLMNALVRRDVAIVSAIPGTTRDLIEVNFDLEGIPVTLVDTAGLREAGDEIEREGIRRTMARAEAADLVLWLTAPGGAPAATGLVPQAPVVYIRSKCDLGFIESGAEQDLSLSAHSGAGLPELLELICTRARTSLRPGEPPLMSRERHRLGMTEALAALARIHPATPVEVAAEELRVAARALASIIGLVGAEDVLGEIFSRFCIGK
jgi:tRNA modification GTPase